MSGTATLILTKADADDAVNRLKLTTLVFAKLANTAADAQDGSEDEQIAKEMAEWALKLALRIAKAQIDGAKP